jgi:tryptophan halogenase
VLLGKGLGEPFISYKPTLYCDRAVVGGWERAEEPIKPYTTVEGMEAGWCWQIDHEHRINRGYVYSSGFISDEDARRELVAKNPKIAETRVVKFISGRYERCWVKNVVAIGNASGFVEPLEATSLGAICDESYALAELLADCDMDPGEQMVRQYNKRCGTSWDLIRNFLAIHYRFNTRFDTPFWRECREKVELFGAAEMVEYFQENGPSTLFRQNLLHEADPFKMEGYLTLLVGQKVPYRKKYVPTAAEKATWAEIRAYLRAQGQAGYSIKEAVENVRSGKWSWGADFFKQNPFTVGG